MGDAGRARALTVYTREPCALCDHLVLALELLRPRFKFNYAKVDVDSEAELADAYGLRVPVLVDKDTEICSGHCDPAVVEAYLTRVEGSH